MINPQQPEARSTADENAPKGSAQPSSTAEWVSLAIAATLLVSIIGLVLRLWVSEQQQQPPILSVSYAEARSAQGNFYVPFEVVNTGGATAESVQIIAELQINGVVVESGEQILDFLSSQEQADGAFVFTHDPQQGKLSVRIASYQNP